MGGDVHRERDTGRLRRSLAGGDHPACLESHHGRLTGQQAGGGEERERFVVDLHRLTEGVNLAEGAVENIFLIKDGKLLTNDQNSSILLGITRDSAIQIARHLGYEVEIRNLKLHELLSADEVFLTGTAIEVMPVREVDGKIIGSGARGPITEQIQKTFFDIVSGRKPEFKHWLHPIGQAAAVGAVA